jgi:hypothetical protein
MVLRFPTLNMQRNRCESVALYRTEQLNGQNNQVLLATKEKDKTLGQLLGLDKSKNADKSSTQTHLGLFPQPA